MTLTPTQEARRKRLGLSSTPDKITIKKANDLIISIGVFVLTLSLFSVVCCMIVYGIIAYNGYPEEFHKIWDLNYYLFGIALSISIANPVGVIIGLVVANNCKEEDVIR